MKSTGMIAQQRDAFAALRTRSGLSDPYPIYRRLHDAGPISRSHTGEWVVVGHQLAHAVLRDHRFAVRTTPYDPQPDSPLRYAPGAEAHFSILEIDGPDHSRLRKLALPAFSPKLMDRYGADIADLTDDLVESTGSDRFDLMAAIAAPLPIAVITGLLGIPGAETGRFQRYGRVVAGAIDGVHSESQAGELVAATREVENLFAELIENGTESDGLIAKLARDHTEQRLTARELLALCRVLLIAGFETTVNLIGNGMLALLSNPAQWELLRDNPDRAAAAVEEILRYDSPVQATPRFAVEDVDLDGHHVATGDEVWVLTGAANHDPEVYPEPGRFDIARDRAASHLAFGGGPHYCLGAPLSRLEGAIVLATLARRLPDLRIDGPVRRRRSMSLRGLATLPVRPGDRGGHDLPDRQPR